MVLAQDKCSLLFLAYYHVPIDPDHRKYLCFVWKGKVYQFRVLCFGLKNAPFTFVRLGEAVRSFLCQRGIRIIIYLDDILVLAPTFEQCLRDAQFVIDTLVKLGFYIKVEKCVFTPSQRFFFLGYLWDTLAMIALLPPEKLENIKELCTLVLESKWVTVKLLQSLFGRILAARPAVPLTRARSRGIQRMVLDHYDGTKQSAKKVVLLSKWAREDITWWLSLQIRDCKLSLRSVPVWETTRLATDAMDTAIGAVMNGTEMYEELDKTTCGWRIAHKEWLAFEKMVKLHLSSLKGKVVCWHVNNTNVKQAWLNSGTKQDKWLCRKVVELQITLHRNNTVVVPVYVRSAQHLHADLISRDKVLPDWHLNREVARKLFKMLGHPEVDLMATSQSHQVPQYYSALADEGALGVDVFTKNWDHFNMAYVFPNPAMLELILNRIYQCRKESLFIVITPWKPKSRWFPKAVALSVRRPLRLPVSWKTVKDMASSNCIPATPSGNKIRFAAWLLTGKAGLRLEDCPLGLSKLYSRAGRKILREVMDWHTDITPSFAESITWMSLSRLQ